MIDSSLKCACFCVNHQTVLLLFEQSLSELFFILIIFLLKNDNTFRFILNVFFFTKKDDTLNHTLKTNASRATFRRSIYTIFCLKIYSYFNFYELILSI